jgi:hypothetical protein
MLSEKLPFRKDLMLPDRTKNVTEAVDNYFHDRGYDFVQYKDEDLVREWVIDENGEAVVNPNIDMTNGTKKLEDYARERSPEKHEAHIKKRGGSSKVSFAVVREKANKTATNKKLQNLIGAEIKVKQRAHISYRKRKNGKNKSFPPPVTLPANNDKEKQQINVGATTKTGKGRGKKGNHNKQQHEDTEKVNEDVKNNNCPMEDDDVDTVLSIPVDEVNYTDDNDDQEVVEIAHGATEAENKTEKKAAEVSQKGVNIDCAKNYKKKEEQKVNKDDNERNKAIKELKRNHKKVKEAIDSDHDNNNETDSSSDDRSEVEVSSKSKKKSKATKNSEKATVKKRKRNDESSPEPLKRSKGNDSDSDENDGNGGGQMRQMLSLLQKMQGKNSKINIQINF